jgi:small-conductance mechanosensitive channel
MDFRLGPFLVPLGAFAIAIVAIVSNVVGEAQRRRLKAEQRMAMVARGMNADDIDKLLGGVNDDSKRVKDPLRSLANARRTGIVLISTGVGLVVFSLALAWIVGHHEVLSAGAALSPLAIGVGFLIDYQLQKRDLSRFGLEVGHGE